MTADRSPMAFLSSVESFYLDLSSNSSNSVLDKKRGIGTILNDD